MFLKNEFKSGELVMIMPVGIPVTLQYNPKGILEKVYCSIEDDITDYEVSYDMFNSLYESKICPVKIPLTGGTTHVKGVLYTGKWHTGEGSLPYCVLSDMCIEFTERPKTYNFFACQVTSTAAKFNGAAACKRWFNMAKFNQLPSFLVPTPLTSVSFNSAVNRIYEFIPEMIMYFVVYDKSGVRYVSTDIKQHYIHKINEYLDEYGNIKGELIFDDSTLSLDYSDIVRMNIQRRMHIVVDRSGQPLRVFGDSKKRVSGTISCSVCGKQIITPMHGVVKCPDPHCMSNMYPAFSRFLHCYNLLDMTFGEYKAYVQSGLIREISDIFKLSNWSQYNIETSLSDLLRSIVPVSQVADNNAIVSFTQHCNGNVNMFNYYVENPTAIQSDFHLTGQQIGNLVKWLSDKYNKDTLIHLVDCDNVVITDDGKKFNGSPIFRNKRIMITGDFRHGSHEDIKSILKSYSATVVEKFDIDIDCVIIGSTLDGINSVELKKAKLVNTPIFEEDDFFNQYEIDKDMSENLL